MDNLALSDDDSKQSQEGLSAITRLCLPNVQIVCLLNTPTGPVMIDHAQQIIDLEARPDSKTTQQLIRWAVSITRPNVYRHCTMQPAPEGWQEHSLLKNYRVMKFAQAEDGDYVCKLTSDLSVRLSKERGIEIE